MIVAFIIGALVLLIVIGMNDLAKTRQHIRLRERITEERYHERLSDDVRLLWAQRDFPRHNQE